MFTSDGGGQRVAYFAPEIAHLAGQPAFVSIGSSSASYAARTACNARTPEQQVEIIWQSANVPFDELVDPNSESHFISLERLIDWDAQRSGDMSVNDFLFSDSERKPEVFANVRHRLQCTVTYGLVHKKDLQFVTQLERKLRPGEKVEINFWRAAAANVTRFNGRTQMRQGLLPHDLLGGELGHLMRATFDSYTDEGVMSWLDKTPQAVLNAYSSANPLAFNAQLIVTPEGHGLVLADGQMLGPPQLVTKEMNPNAHVIALRTMPIDWWRPYEGTSVHEVHACNERSAAVNFALFDRSRAHEMAVRGLFDSLDCWGERERLMQQVATEPVPLGNDDRVFGFRRSARLGTLLWRNVPALTESLRDPEVLRELARDKALEPIKGVFSSLSFSGIGRKDGQDNRGLELSPA